MRFALESGGRRNLRVSLGLTPGRCAQPVSLVAALVEGSLH